MHAIKIHPLQVHNSVVFNIYKKLQPSPLIPEHFHHLQKGAPYPLAFTSHSSLPQPLATRIYLLTLGCTHSGHFI